MSRLCNLNLSIIRIFFHVSEREFFVFGDKKEEKAICLQGASQEWNKSWMLPYKLLTTFI
jgi:hypothetical protein